MKMATFVKSSTLVSKKGLKTAISVVMLCCLGACSKAKELWQGDETLVVARQDQLEKDVVNVTDNHL